MGDRDYHPGRGSETAAGADVGATLAKLALRHPDGRLELRLLPSGAVEEVARTLGEVTPGPVGLTGGGAAAVAAKLPVEAARVSEFAAWGRGAATLLARHERAAPERYLLVSLGTGTSALLVDGLAVTRVGGTALGGGTLLGLGAGLTGSARFDELVALAGRGRRERVDLRVRDIYRAGEIALAGELTASNFGKLAERLAGSQEVDPADLAHALMGLVGENVALVCGGLAAATQVGCVVFGGATLRGNARLREILAAITRALGREPVFLPEGEFAGALGALLLAAAD